MSDSLQTQLDQPTKDGAWVTRGDWETNVEVAVSHKARAAKPGKFAEVESFLMDGSKMLVQACALVQEKEDANEPLTAALVEHFSFVKLQHKKNVDIAVDFSEATQGFIDLCNAKIKRITKERDRAMAVHKELKRLAKDAVTQNELRPLAGFRGKIYLQRNSNPKLVLAFNDENLTPDMVSAFMIEEKYIKRSINNSAVTADLETGKLIPWASLENGTHARLKG